MPHPELACESCKGPVSSEDRFCRHCGVQRTTDSLSSCTPHTARVRVPSLLATTFSPVPRFRCSFLLLLAATVMLVVLQTPGVARGEGADHGANAGLWHQVGELFTRAQAHQRKLLHDPADDVENGPKEISIFCPSDPQIRIVDLNEDERDRDECLVLNIAAPDVSSRLVLFCNAHPQFRKTPNGTNFYDQSGADADEEASSAHEEM